MKMSNNEYRRGLNKSTSNKSTGKNNHNKKPHLNYGLNSPSHIGYYYIPYKTNENNKPKHKINHEKESNFEDTYFKAINTLSNCQTKMTKKYQLTSENKVNRQLREDKPPLMTPFPIYSHYPTKPTTAHNKNIPTNQNTNVNINVDIDNHNKKPQINKNASKNNKDNRLEYTLNSLNMTAFITTFNDNQIEFDDLLLLTKDDLKEMSIPIGPRNRLLTFKNNYSNYANNHTIEEIQSFFHQNKYLDHFSSVNICSTDSSAVRHQRCNSSCIDMKKQQDNLLQSPYAPLKTDKNSSDMYISDYIDHNQSKYSPRVNTNEAGSVRNTNINLNYNFNRRVLSNTDINKDEQMQFYNPNENNQKKKSNTTSGSVIPRSKGKNYTKKREVDAVALSNNIEKLLSKSNTKMQPYSEHNRIQQNKLKSIQNFNQKEQDEINKLFEIEANLKSHLEECNKSINQKQLLLRLLDESKKYK